MEVDLSFIDDFKVHTELFKQQLQTAITSFVTWQTAAEKRIKFLEQKCAGADVCNPEAIGVPSDACHFQRAFTRTDTDSALDINDYQTDHKASKSMLRSSSSPEASCCGSENNFYIPITQTGRRGSLMSHAKPLAMMHGAASDGSPFASPRNITLDAAGSAPATPELLPAAATSDALAAPQRPPTISTNFIDTREPGSPMRLTTDVVRYTTCLTDASLNLQNVAFQDLLRDASAPPLQAHNPMGHDMQAAIDLNPLCSPRGQNCSSLEVVTVNNRRPDHLAVRDSSKSVASPVHRSASRSRTTSPLRVPGDDGHPPATRTSFQSARGPLLGRTPSLSVHGCSADNVGALVPPQQLCSSDPNMDFLHRAKQDDGLVQLYGSYVRIGMGLDAPMFSPQKSGSFDHLGPLDPPENPMQLSALIQDGPERQVTAHTVKGRKDSLLQKSTRSESLFSNRPAGCNAMFMMTYKSTAGSGFTWIDVIGNPDHKTEEYEQYLTDLGKGLDIHAITIKDCLVPFMLPKVEKIGDWSAHSSAYRSAHPTPPPPYPCTFPCLSPSA